MVTIKLLNIKLRYCVIKLKGIYVIEYQHDEYGEFMINLNNLYGLNITE